MPLLGVCIGPVHVQHHTNQACQLTVSSQGEREASAQPTRVNHLCTMSSNGFASTSMDLRTGGSSGRSSLSVLNSPARKTLKIVAPVTCCVCCVCSRSERQGNATPPTKTVVCKPAPCQRLCVCHLAIRICQASQRTDSHCCWGGSHLPWPLVHDG